MGRPGHVTSSTDDDSNAKSQWNGNSTLTTDHQPRINTLLHDRTNLLNTPGLTTSDDHGNAIRFQRPTRRPMSFFNTADKQTYFLTVAPGVDAALLLAICICLVSRRVDCANLGYGADVSDRGLRKETRIWTNIVASLEGDIDHDGFSCWNIGRGDSLDISVDKLRERGHGPRTYKVDETRNDR